VRVSDERQQDGRGRPVPLVCVGVRTLVIALEALAVSLRHASFRGVEQDLEREEGADEVLRSVKRGLSYGKRALFTIEYLSEVAHHALSSTPDEDE